VKKVIRFLCLILTITLPATALGGCRLISGIRKIVEISDKLDSDDIDMSDCYVEFTVTGQENGSTRFEGEAANDCVGMMPEAENYYMFSLSGYDADARIVYNLVSRFINFATDEEQADIPVMASGAMVWFHTDEGHDDYRWEDSYNNFIWPLFFGSTDNYEEAALVWVVHTSQLSGLYIEIEGTCRSVAANNPTDQGASNYDEALAAALIEDAAMHPGRQPAYDAAKFGAGEISIQVKFRVIIMDITLLAGDSED